MVQRPLDLPELPESFPKEIFDPAEHDPQRGHFIDSAQYKWALVLADLAKHWLAFADHDFVSGS